MCLKNSSSRATQHEEWRNAPRLSSCSRGIMISALCNNSNSVAFIYQYRSACAQVAASLDVPMENILGLAAQESQYGTGRIARELNNYFSLHAPAPMQIGAESPKGNTKIKVAKFSSFLQCAQSFAVRYGSAVRGKKDPLDFARALVRAGFNSGNASNGGRAGFDHYLAGIINAVKARATCPAK